MASFVAKSVKTVEGYVMLRLKLLALVVFEIFKKNHFVTSVEAVAKADIDDSINRNRIHVSFQNFLLTVVVTFRIVLIGETFNAPTRSKLYVTRVRKMLRMHLNCM